MKVMNWEITPKPEGPRYKAYSLTLTTEAMKVTITDSDSLYVTFINLWMIFWRYNYVIY